MSFKFSIFYIHFRFARNWLFQPITQLQKIHLKSTFLNTAVYHIIAESPDTLAGHRGLHPTLGHINDRRHSHGNVNKLILECNSY